MENIEIPSHFICPISLQLMKDPVTIPTGITYDRESIEKWLFTCKNTTCPVTKLGLISTPFDHHQNHNMITPNHTLRRLIQSWCILHASDGVERIPTPKQPPIVNHAYVTKLISDARKSSKLRHSCIQRILSITASNEGRIKKILESSGAFSYVASVLLDEEYDRRDKEEALSFFAQLGYNNESIFKGLIKNNGEHLLFIKIVIDLLRSGSFQVRKNAIKVLRSVYKVSDSNQLCDIPCDLIKEIVNVARDNISSQSTKCALKLLVDLNPWGRNRIKSVGSGLVNVLVDLLVDGLDRRLCELGLTVLDQLCGCAEGRADLVGHGAGLAVVSKKILRVSHLASDRAVKILMSVSRYLATRRVLVEMMEVGVVVKLCMVIQVECSLKSKERAKEMLRLHSHVWSPCIPPHMRSSYPSN